MMAKPVEPGIGTTRNGHCVSRTRRSDWEPIRGLHQGQRSYVPHQQAGHMTAPDQDAKPPQNPCAAGVVHTCRSAEPSCSMGRALGAVHVEEFILSGGFRACTRSIQAPDRSVSASVASVASHSVSKRPIWLLEAAARSRPSRPTLARNRGIAGEPLGVVDVLVASEPAEHRLAEQSASMWRAFLPRRPARSFVIAMAVSPSASSSSR